MRQMGEEEGEVELINCDYTTKRFPFTYSWWSAYGYKRHLTGDNMPDGDDMLLVDQVRVRFVNSDNSQSYIFEKELGVG